MGFVANGNNTPSHIQIKSDPFYPIIVLDQIREIVRIDGAVTNERLQQAIIEEVLDTNRLLVSLKAKAGALSELSTTQINDQPDTDFLYLSAVANGVAAKFDGLDQFKYQRCIQINFVFFAFHVASLNLL